MRLYSFVRITGDGRLPRGYVPGNRNPRSDNASFRQSKRPPRL